MSEQQFFIEITDQSVEVRLEVSRNSPRIRFYASIFFFSMLGALVVCGLLFLPGKHGNPSMWRDLSSSPLDSSGFVVPLLILLAFPVLAILLLRRYIVSAYPSDETFHCDRSTLTVSRVRWLDIHNKHWDTRSYGLGDTANFRYQVLGRAKGASIYGLRFVAGGRKERVLPGLNPREAEKVLNAIKMLGADVPNDPALSRKF
jgi:hypothetical protein